jgi:membrane protease YdiL (CAAX protease family)
MLVVAVGVQVVAYLVARPTPPDPRVVSIVGTLAMALAVMVMARRAGLEWSRVFGPPLTRESAGVLATAVPINIVPILMLISAGSVFIMVPLSYVAPGFVERFFLTPSDAFVARTGVQLALLLVVGAVFAPIAEEVFFRGILMQRWGRRWGTLTGVLASSAVFGLLHQEWIGRFVAGVFLAALYLRTRRLWVPIVVHALTNLLVMAPFGVYRLLHPATPDRTTLAELRDALPESALKVMLGVVLVGLYVRLYWPGGMLAAALGGRVPYDDRDAPMGDRER